MQSALGKSTKIGISAPFRVKLLGMSDEIRAFIKAHDAELKVKPEA